MPGTSSSCAPGIAWAVERPPEVWTIRSFIPWMTVAGILSARSARARFGWVSTAIMCRITPAGLSPRS
jgi:hypothetical protein